MEQTVARGVAALRAAQGPHGAWMSTPEMGPLALAMTALTEYWLGSLTSDDAGRYLSALRKVQRKDGGFEIYPGSNRSSLGATAVCRAAMKACGAKDGAPMVRSAEARIRALGGYEMIRSRFLSNGEPAALFCVMVGLLPADALPPISPDMAALPWSERMLDGRMHGGAPMVLYACAAVRERFKPQGLLPGFLRGPTRLVARTRLAAYIGQFQNPNGSWNCAVYCTVFALVALEGVGVDARDPMILRGLAWLESRKRRAGTAITVSIFDAEIWETAFAMLALSACGVRESDDAIRRGALYLEEHQCKQEQPRVNQPKPGAPRTGGWAFQSGNDTMPDCDDTGVAIAALGRAGRRPGRATGAAAERGIAWLRGMQNNGGGFGSYVHGLPDKPPGGSMFRTPKPNLNELRGVLETISNPPPEYGDPAIADLVGRVLWGLGECGLTVADPMVRKAVSFLERDVCPDGPWWGIWNPAYVSGTAFALLGLASVKADLDAPYVGRAVAWLISVQNEDGGYGEVPESFFDPTLAGEGPSMPPLTGIALRALAEIVDRKGPHAARASKAAERAAQYLIETQEKDGGWPSNGYVFTIVPPTFYAWGLSNLYYVLYGLGRWAQVRSGANARRALQ